VSILLAFDKISTEIGINFVLVSEVLIKFWVDRWIFERAMFVGLLDWYLWSAEMMGDMNLADKILRWTSHSGSMPRFYGLKCVHCVAEITGNTMQVIRYSGVGCGVSSFIEGQLSWINSAARVLRCRVFVWKLNRGGIREWNTAPTSSIRTKRMRQWKWNGVNGYACPSIGAIRN